MHKIIIKLYSDKPLYNFVFKERYLFVVKNLNENYLIRQCNTFLMMWLNTFLVIVLVLQKEKLGYSILKLI